MCGLNAVKSRQQVKTVVVIAIVALLMFGFVIVNFKQPVLRRLSWLRCPGAFAIYARGRVEPWGLPVGSLRMEVVEGSLSWTTIKVNTWGDSGWSVNATYFTSPIFESTNFWIANGVTLGSSITYLFTNQTAEITRIAYDGVDEADEGTSYQIVMIARSLLPDANQFVGRYIVDCGLVTSWWYEDHSRGEDSAYFRLHASNIFFGIYNGFTMGIFLIVGYSAMVVFLIASSVLLVEGVRYLRNASSKSTAHG
jgi:hypothetical protein